MANEEQKRGLLGNIVSILIVIVIVAVGLWGLTWLLQGGLGSLPSFFGGNEELTLTPESMTVEPDVPFTLQWTDSTRGSGVYAFAYQCVNGVTLAAASTLGSYSDIACDTPYQIASDARALPLVAHVTAPNAVDIPFALAYIENGAKIAEASGVMNVTARGGTTTPSTGSGTTTPTKPTTQKPPTTKPQGNGTPSPSTNKPTYVNLAIQNIQTGWSDGYYGWSVKNTFNSMETAAVRFRVTNTGTGTSGQWRFIADLPTSPAQPYISEYQRGLRPGESFEFTVRADHLQVGNPAFVIRIETIGADMTPGDNTASAAINVYNSGSW